MKHEEKKLAIVLKFKRDLFQKFPNFNVHSNFLPNLFDVFVLFIRNVVAFRSSIKFVFQPLMPHDLNSKSTATVL